MRKPRSQPWSPISVKRCPRPKSSSATTIPPIAPLRSRARPAHRCAASAAKARVMWSGGCSPISTPMSMCWSMAMRPMTLQAERLDMVVGLRVDQAAAAYRRGHRTGNRMLTGFLASVFGQAFKDILSGYRVFSRRFVKSFPVLSDGFEIETELSVHALELALPVAEIETPYYARPEGSFSKLNTWRDGFRI